MALLWATHRAFIVWLLAIVTIVFEFTPKTTALVIAAQPENVYPTRYGMGSSPYTESNVTSLLAGKTSPPSASKVTVYMLGSHCHVISDDKVLKVSGPVVLAVPDTGTEPVPLQPAQIYPVASADAVMVAVACHAKVCVPTAGTDEPRAERTARV
jgi:hypothetical protein